MTAADHYLYITLALVAIGVATGVGLVVVIGGVHCWRLLRSLSGGVQVCGWLLLLVAAAGFGVGVCNWYLGCHTHAGRYAYSTETFAVETKAARDRDAEDRDRAWLPLTFVSVVVGVGGLVLANSKRR